MNNFSDNLLNEYTNGIKKSFKYLQDDINYLNIEIKPIKVFDELEIYKNQNGEYRQRFNIPASKERREENGVLDESSFQFRFADITHQRGDKREPQPVDTEAIMGIYRLQSASTAIHFVHSGAFHRI